MKLPKLDPEKLAEIQTAMREARAQDESERVARAKAGIAKIAELIAAGIDGAAKVNLTQIATSDFCSCKTKVERQAKIHAMLPVHDGSECGWNRELALAPARCISSVLELVSDIDPEDIPQQLADQIAEHMERSAAAFRALSSH